MICQGVFTNFNTFFESVNFDTEKRQDIANISVPAPLLHFDFTFTALAFHFKATESPLNPFQNHQKALYLPSIP